MGLLDQFRAYVDANTPRSTRPAVSPAQVIDEGLLGGRIGQIPQRAQEVYQGLLNAPGELAQLASPQAAKAVQNAYQPTISSLITNPRKPLDKDKAMGMAMDMLQTTTPVGGLVGMFIGQGAKTWDAIAAQHADDLLKQGVDPREVWKQTGTLKGVDGALRQEIPDNSARMVDPDTTPGLLDKMIAADPSSKGMKGIPQAMALEDVLRHPELDRAYFNVREDAPSVMFDSLGSTRGRYSDGFVTLNNANILDAEPAQRSTMLHELQHAIQQREGWARGGSPDEFSVASPGDREIMMEPLRSEISSLARRKHEDATFGFSGFERGKPETMADPEIQGLLAKLKEMEMRFDPMAQYKLLAGEAEARATQARMGMDMNQRLETYPFDSYDVPVDNLIVRGLLGE